MSQQEGNPHCDYRSLVNMWFLTDANVSFQNHADIIGTVSDGEGDGAAFGVLHQFNYLKKEQDSGQPLKAKSER